MTEKGIPTGSYDRVAEPVVVDIPAHLRAHSWILKLFAEHNNDYVIFSELLFLTMQLPFFC